MGFLLVWDFHPGRTGRLLFRRLKMSQRKVSAARCLTNAHPRASLALLQARPSPLGPSSAGAAAGPPGLAGGSCGAGSEPEVGRKDF